MHRTRLVVAALASAVALGAPLAASASAVASPATVRQVDASSFRVTIARTYGPWFARVTLYGPSHTVLETTGWGIGNGYVDIEPLECGQPAKHVVVSVFKGKGPSMATRYGRGAGYAYNPNCGPRPAAKRPCHKRSGHAVASPAARSVAPRPVVATVASLGSAVAAGVAAPAIARPGVVTFTG